MKIVPLQIYGIIIVINPKLTTILFALLILGCKEAEQVKPTEPPKLDCAVSCDDAKIKEWYQKKYGEPITDFELSITKIDFKSEEWTNCKLLYSRKKDFKQNSHSPQFRSLAKKLYSYKQSFNISITKTATNALLTITKNEEQFKSELSMEEWLNQIRSLYSITNEWEKEYEDPFYKPSWCSERWSLYIYSSGKNEPDIFKGIEAYPSNWFEFKKIIDDMTAKIKGK